MMKIDIKNLEKDEYGQVCCRCWNSVCDPCDPDCDGHPMDYGQRWCHKYEKPVENLQDASQCKGFDGD